MCMVAEVASGITSLQREEAVRIVIFALPLSIFALLPATVVLLCVALAPSLGGVFFGVVP